MKKFLSILKPFLLPIIFEATIILSQSFGEKNDAHIFFYFIFTIIAIYCFVYNEFILQLAIALFVALIEGCLIKYQNSLFDLFCSFFHQKLTTRNTTDNFLICVFLQFIAFIIAVIIAQRKKRITNQNNNID